MGGLIALKNYEHTDREELLSSSPADAFGWLSKGHLHLRKSPRTLCRIQDLQ
jgi:hypothetical protein